MTHLAAPTTYYERVPDKLLADLADYFETARIEDEARRLRAHLENSAIVEDRATQMAEEAKEGGQ